MSTNPAPIRSLSIEQKTDDDGNPVLVCSGRMNLETTEQFKTEVKKLSADHKQIDADMSAIDNIDSAGLGSLLGTYISAKNQGCDLRLINVNPRLKDLLNITHLTSVLNVQS